LIDNIFDGRNESILYPVNYNIYRLDHLLTWIKKKINPR